MKNVALRYLSRLVAVTGKLSFPTALTDGTVKLDVPEEDKKYAALLREAGRRDGLVKDEATALAREHRWSLLRQSEGHERWPSLDGARLEHCLPRIYRILRREAWEARDMARGCDDEDVSSLLHDFAAKREALLGELQAMAPISAQLGA